MKVFSVLLGAVALIAGIAGGVHAYSASVGSAPTPAAPAAAPSYPPAQVVRPGVVVRWAPCRPPAVLQGRTCVTHVTRTITPAALPAAPSSAWAHPRRPAVASPTSEPSDDGGHHGDDSGNQGGHHGDDGGHDGGGGDD